MAADIATARDELFDLLAADANGTPKPALVTAGVVRVYAYDQLTYSDGCSVILSVEGMTPDDFQLIVRIYYDLKTTADVVNAQETVDAAIMAVDAALHQSSQYGPSQFQVIMDRELGAYIAESRVDCPRQDGYYS